jgi:hypothetical protein
MNIDFLDDETKAARDSMMAYAEVMKRWSVEDQRRYETWNAGTPTIVKRNGVECVVVTFARVDVTSGMRASDDSKGWAELQDAARMRLEVSIETAHNNQPWIPPAKTLNDLVREEQWAELDKLIEPMKCQECERNTARIKTLEARLEAIRRVSVGEYLVLKS